MFNLKQMAPATYILPQTDPMKVPGLVIATERLLQESGMEEPLKQVRNVACLPGIVGYSIAMPDMHWGYGFPIGGVAAVDAKEGVISPGGVGYDINCGVRLAVIPVPFKNLTPKLRKQLLGSIYHKVPSGVGHQRKNITGLTDRDYDQIAKKGALWSIERGYGFATDLESMESHGVIDGADANAVSQTAKQRGRFQLGTIGSGNHFAEIGEIDKVYLPDIASAWGIDKDEQTYILIHSGSRGFGHQVCQDTLDAFIRKGFANDLPDRQLVCAPIQSPEGRGYFAAMATAANFAFNNRQQILHAVREACQEVLGVNPEEVRLIYDVCHNIAKFESHPVDGKMKELCVHRKGATRAFGKGSKELSSLYQATGQPVLVPGDMGRASHLMVGLGNSLTWSSSCHGAGRARSRIQSLKSWKGRDPYAHMKSLGVDVMAASDRTIVEEMPDAYKDVDEVVDAVQQAGLANMVARLRPQMVIKG
jgi:tRNA-splicing ligase RtcB (3'-phosphate/5'-hydroxy nucleic acid ligase)